MDIYNWAKVWKTVGLIFLFLGPLILILLKNATYSICAVIRDFKDAERKQLLKEEKTEEIQHRLIKNGIVHARCGSIRKLIREWFDINNSCDHPIKTLYTIFWILGGIVCTFIAVVLIIVEGATFATTRSSLSCIEKQYNLIITDQNFNELTFRDALLFNRQLAEKRTNPGNLEYVKPEIIEDYISKYIINEDELREKLIAKYKSLKSFFNGEMKIYE